MEMHTVYRKKPKKADFIYNKVRYWVAESHYYEFWTGEYERNCIYTIKEYETDRDVGDDDELNDDDEFLSKAQSVACRLMPFDVYVYD